MIKRFRQVNENLYRGSAPSIEDVSMLKNKFGINKIVSLDYNSGKRIDRATKLLNIKHVMLPIEFAKKSSLIKFLNHNIVDLLDNDGPTFIHCAQGKDRTGLAIAMYRCEHDGWTCGKALKEAKQLGYGIGVPPQVLKVYSKLIKSSCNCKDSDVNSAYDIVSNEREDDHIGGSSTQLSWSPYEDYRVRQYPYSKDQIDWPEQYESRQDYELDDSGMDKERPSRGIPQSGGYDTSTDGINGAGPSLVGSGYI